MEETERWSELLLEVEENLGQAYELLGELHAELRDAGLKKEAGAVGEARDRLARYGQTFGELRASWSDDAAWD
jgi:hypothetical protein